MGDKDKAFRRLLADERLFLKFLRRFLKQNLPDVIDVEALTLDNLHREDITFIPPDLSERESDVLYRIQETDAEAYVYVLVEHQSSVSHLMPFRLLSYVV